MRIDTILQKIGASLVRVEQKEDLKLFIRISKDPHEKNQWKLVIEEMLLAADDKKAKKDGWEVDISQSYYLVEGGVRYIWRVWLKGSLKPAAVAFGNAVMRAVGAGNDVMSAPLVGNKPWRYDPASGRLKGGHDPGAAAAGRAAVPPSANRGRWPKRN